MSVDIDTRELISAAVEMRRTAKKLAPAVDKIVGERAEAVAVKARANALADAVEPRPWLGTSAGVVVQKRREGERRIISPRDPMGQSVGYRVEYGTSLIAARPFLNPALKAEQPRFDRDLLNALVRSTL